MSLLLLFGGGGAPPPPDPGVPDWSQSSIGPRGLLGIPPRKFRERILPISPVVTSTEARFTQAGLEAWTKTTTPNTHFTQAGLEIWINSDDQLRRLVNVYFL